MTESEAQVSEAKSARNHPPVGGRLRAARQLRGMSLRELAERVSLSASLISQIENGRARPSVNTLYSLANELDVSLDDLLFPDAERNGSSTETGTRADPVADAPPVPGAPRAPGGRDGPVQRADARKRIRLASRVVWERLTPGSEPGTEFLYVTYEVGGASSPENEFQRHGGHEWGFILSGHLRVTIGFDDYELGPGDSISIDSGTPHRLYNTSDRPAHAIWFVLGRHSNEIDLAALRSAAKGPGQ